MVERFGMELSFHLYLRALLLQKQAASGTVIAIFSYSNITIAFIRCFKLKRRVGEKSAGSIVLRGYRDRRRN